MHKPLQHLFLKLFGMLVASAALAVVIACTANAPLSTPTAPWTATALPAPAVNPSTPPVGPSPTHRPRQHSGAHIQGLGESVDSPHFIDSFPNHAQTLIQSPARVGINFDVSLADGSRLTVERDGEPVAVGAPEFDPRRIYMSARLPADLGDGLYRVEYRACFADSSCAEGQVGFQVDAARLQEFVDLTAEKEVTIHLERIKYQPNLLIISPGTTVTWVNDDSFEHFVNSDPHPSHNAFPALNSLDIPPTGIFSFTFTEAGEYAFHCSAHVPQNMFGTILVRAAADMRNTQPTGNPSPAAQLVPTVVPTATTAPPTAAAQLVPSAVPTVPLAPSPTLVPTLVPVTAEPTATALPEKLKVPESDLPPQRFAAHFVRSEPEHADLVASVPSQVHIYFDFTLARSSNIEIRKDGDKLPLDGWELSENRLRMTVNVPDAGAGMYHVLFNACWPDKSCHPGEFAFVVRE